jgi:hypothetical protein
MYLHVKFLLAKQVGGKYYVHTSINHSIHSIHSIHSKSVGGAVENRRRFHCIAFASARALTAGNGLGSSTVEEMAAVC